LEEVPVEEKNNESVQIKSTTAATDNFTIIPLNPEPPPLCLL